MGTLASRRRVAWVGTIQYALDTLPEYEQH